MLKYVTIVRRQCWNKMLSFAILMMKWKFCEQADRKIVYTTLKTPQMNGIINLKLCVTIYGSGGQ